MTIYNDNDPTAAAWLRALIAAGELEGEVDERSIEEVKPADLVGHDRYHAFSGIGGWELALRLAGWPADRQVWSGSCPCQPFSVAGKREGKKDPRHLWPVFLRLIKECHPATLFGEQVDGADGYHWIAGVRDDLEAEGYAVGIADLPACSAGSPIKRNRLFFVAVTSGTGCKRRSGLSRKMGQSNQPTDDGGAIPLADAGCERRQRRQGAREGGKSNRSKAGRKQGDDEPTGIHQADPGGVACADGWQPSDGDLQRSGEHGQRPQDGGASIGVGGSTSGGCGIGGDASFAADGGHAIGSGGPRYIEPADYLGGLGGAPIIRNGQASLFGGFGEGQEEGRERGGGGSGTSNHWSAYNVVRCRDDKTRRVPVEPALFPLVAGLPGRLGLLRGAGNSIVSQVAAAFVRAFLESEGEI